MILEVWITTNGGQRIVLPIEVRPRAAQKRRA